ncbi:MAG: peptidylprolyl isomerase [Candidatus Aureabacteria bacterium]|nr:peptidylprolyl isomerase [Candidatus Auribacterota bacterium]
MVQAKMGDRVKVHYKGTLDNGDVFDSSYERHPIEFTIGEQKLIPGFESALVGMNEGEKKTVNVLSDEAYGQAQADLIAVVKKDRLPSNIEPCVGQVLQVTSQGGAIINFAITDMTDDTVTLDANHPLAGKDLLFEIELLQII